MGGTDVFKASLFTGYALPKINIKSKIKKCFSGKKLSHCEWVSHRFIR